MSQRKKQLHGAEDTYQAAVSRVSAVGIGANLALTLFKLAAGILGRSSAMLSDAVHSLSDIAGGLIVVVGVNLSERQADEDHPYGHERLECIASLLLAVILLVAALAMGRSAAVSIVTGSYRTAAVPGGIALIAAVVSIAVKEGLYRWTMARAGILGSGALRAEAWHHRSDALSSVGSLIGVGGAMLGLRVLDPAASLVICLFILKAAYDIAREAVERMTDHTGGQEWDESIRACAEGFPDIQGIDLLRTREFGRKLYVDLEIRMDGSLTLAESHNVAEALHDELETRFPQIKHVMIHVNPS